MIFSVEMEFGMEFVEVVIFSVRVELVVVTMVVNGTVLMVEVTEFVVATEMVVVAALVAWTGQLTLHTDLSQPLVINRLQPHSHVRGSIVSGGQLVEVMFGNNPIAPSATGRTKQFNLHISLQHPSYKTFSVPHSHDCTLKILGLQGGSSWPSPMAIVLCDDPCVIG